jgi:hypothetical protein
MQKKMKKIGLDIERLNTDLSGINVVAGKL